MYYTGFADEAARDLEGQIAATKALGWSNIESRCIDGVNIHDVTDEQFDHIYARLSEEGIHINCFGSAIANWQKQITSEEDFAKDLEQVARAIPRMQKLGTKLIRIMSYANLKDTPPEGQFPEKRIERLRVIVDKLLSAGIQPVHENCMNYGGLGWSYTLELVDRIPGLKLVFDTGNPVFNLDYTKPAPHPYQNAWEFYNAVRNHVEYIHIKDGRMVDGKMHFSYCGEGDGCVQQILDDLFRNGYDGGISIEPHLGQVFHDADATASAQHMRDTYHQYGLLIQKLVASAKAHT